MSKLNRREFKELLTEWNSNFINERSIKDFGDFTGITKQQSEFVKSVPVDLNLYAIGDYYVDKENTLPISYVLIEAMKSSANVFRVLRDSVSLILDKSAIPEMIGVLEFLLGESSFSYHSHNNEMIQDKNIKEKSKLSIEKMKEDLNSLKSDSHGIMLYFPRMDSYANDMADGSINKIGNVTDPAVWKNSLSWELKHDVFHYFEEVLSEFESESYSFIKKTFMNIKNIYKVLIRFRVPDQELKSSDDSVRFSTSLLDGDNFATIVPYIRSLENNEANKKAFVDKCSTIAESIGIEFSRKEESDLKLFFEKTHQCYDEVEDILKDKIIIQRSHG